MNLKRVTPLVWTLLWLIIGCQSIGAFVEGGREVDLTEGDDQKNMSQEIVVQKRTATNCYRGMANDTRLELIRDDMLDRDILCDTQTDGGGWIVIQRRTTGDVDFYRNWTEYRNGFGTPPGDFWLGNEALSNLTKWVDYELLIDFFDGAQNLFARYTKIHILSEADGYRLLLGSYSGTLGEDNDDYGLSYHHYQQFSTYDRDNDKHYRRNCAERHHGAWWYRRCHAANLNGRWRNRSSEGMRWYTGSTLHFAYTTEMKIRLV